MRTRTSHGTGKGRRSVLPSSQLHIIFITIVVPIVMPISVLGLAALFAGCGGSAAPGEDAALQGDGGVEDAFVDNGPLDCGVRPYDGAVCVHGRLHDWVSGDPIPARRELSIYGFQVSVEQEAARDTPEKHGRIVPNGRFYAWMDWGENDDCLATVDDVEGYLPATVNCYSYSPNRFDWFLRFYLVPVDVIPGWVEGYPGFARLDSDRPLFLGQCLLPNWSRPTVAQGSTVMGMSPPHHTWLDADETVFFSQDRLSFVGEAVRGYATREMPAGGASIYYIPRECEGCEGTLSFWQVMYECNSHNWGTSNKFYLDTFLSGEAQINILNVVME